MNHKRYIAALCAVCVVACGTGSDQPIDIVESSDTGRDGFSREDAGIAGDASQDSDSDSGDSWLVQEVECPTNNSDAQVTYPQGPPFMPVRGDIGVDSRIEKSRQEPLGEAGLLLTLQASGTNNYRSGSRGWVINRPGDIGFSMAISTTKALAPDTTLTLTTTMDYAPATTNWELVGEFDDEMEQVESASGFHTSFDEPVEVVHGTIPYEAFSEPGYHELVIAYAAAGPSQFITTEVLRLSIWNQSGSRLQHPCFVRTEATPNSETEIVMRSFLNGQSSVSYLNGEQDQTHLRDGVVVRAGEEITVNYFITGTATYQLQEFPAAVIPTLNGRSLADAELIITPVVQEDASQRPVYRETVFRNSITFNAPDEPGAYDFYALIVLNALKPRTTPDGLYIEGVEPAFGSFATKLRLLVEE